MTRPPSADVAVVERFVAAFNRRDVNAALEVVHPAAALVPPPSPRYIPPGTSYHGRAGARTMLEAIFAQAPRLQLEWRGCKPLGSRLLVTFALIDPDRRAGNDATAAVLYRIAGDQIVRSETFASEDEASRAADSRLTPREREVFRLLALGLNAWEISDKLSIAPDTVRTHVRNGVVKLGAKTRVQAVALALTLGEIEL